MTTKITFRENCKIKISIASFCLGIGTDQLTPVYMERVNEEVLKVYGSGNHLFQESIKANSFSKQTLNDEKRAQYRH